MPKMQHFAFKQDYDNLSSRLSTEADVFGVSAGLTRNGIKKTLATNKRNKL